MSQSRWVSLSVFGLAMVLLGSCAEIRNVEEAASRFTAPAEFVLTDSETLNAFEEVQRQLTYTTASDGDEACELGHQALEDWAGVSPELWEREAPRLLCRFELFDAPNFPEIDFAAVDVARSLTGSAGPGGVSEITVTFAVDKS